MMTMMMMEEEDIKTNSQQVEAAAAPVTTDCVVDTSDAVLESIDTCVAFAEGVDLQRDFEEQHMDHALSEDDLNSIRRQVNNGKGLSSTSYLPNIEDLNICGSDSDVVKDTQNESNKDPTPKAEMNGTARGVDEDPNSSRLHCAICFDEEADKNGETNHKNGDSPQRRVEFAYFPCCGSDGREETSTTKVCTGCVLLLTNPTSDGTARIGRCPRCRSWISITLANNNNNNNNNNEETTAQSQEEEQEEESLLKKQIVIEAVSSAGKCKICNQLKSHLVDDHACDACFLGMGSPLLYECKDCHIIQRIPHPMYRYQSTVDDFGATSWACQGQCRNFTLWRIRPDQVRLIPAGDVPEEWGEDFLQMARERVMEARRQLDWDRNDNTPHASWGETACVIQ